jgi:hypothetical protein
MILGCLKIRLARRFVSFYFYVGKSYISKLNVLNTHIHKIMCWYSCTYQFSDYFLEEIGTEVAFMIR